MFYSQYDQDSPELMLACVIDSDSSLRLVSYFEEFKMTTDKSKFCNMRKWDITTGASMSHKQWFLMPLEQVHILHKN